MESADPHVTLPGHVQQSQYGIPASGMQMQNQPVAALWMAKPEGTAGCPPGLEYLCHLDQLMARQYMEIGSGAMGMPVANNSWYKVENSMGQQIYVVTEEKDMSGVCVPGQRGYTMHVTDNVGNEALRISRKPICCSCCPCCGCCNHLIQIEAPVGNTIGYIKSQKKCMTPYFVITDAEDQEIFSMTFPLCSTSSPLHQQDFEIKSVDNQSHVATISKLWGRMEFYFRLKDFTLKFPSDLDVRMKAVLLGCIFVVDVMYYPPHQRVQRRTRRSRRM